MRFWIISAITGLRLITSASPFAQGADQNTRQQIDQIVAAYHENWNNHNAAGIAGLYTKDGVLVTPSAKVVIAGVTVTAY
jgi:hypothetical protein